MPPAALRGVFARQSAVQGEKRSLHPRPRLCLHNGRICCRAVTPSGINATAVPTRVRYAA